MMCYYEIILEMQENMF